MSRDAGAVGNDTVMEGVIGRSDERPSSCAFTCSTKLSRRTHRTDGEYLVPTVRELVRFAWHPVRTAWMPIREPPSQGRHPGRGQSV